MKKNIEERPVFALSKLEDGTTQIIIGVPRAAWIRMRNGQTSTFDFARVGVNLRLLLFGGKNHAAVMKMIEDGAAAGGIAVDNQLNKDFSIKGTEDDG